jgi:hypothetical protein
MADQSVYYSGFGEQYWRASYSTFFLSGAAVESDPGAEG